MRTLRQNEQKLYYAQLLGTVPVYVLDENGNKVVDYVDSDGNIYYVETGSDKPLYSTPVEFSANIGFSVGTGEAQYTEFGVDISDYDATLVYSTNKFPIKETTLIWFQTEPTFDSDGNVISEKADYKVVAIKPSLNETKVLLRRLIQ